jgi:hypothetical protein
MGLLDALELERKRRIDAFAGIGEPAVPLNPKHVLVSSKDPTDIHIRIDHLIELVRSTLEN